MADRLEHVLQECLVLLRQGVSLDECLARYPRDAEALEPLLQAAKAAQVRLAADMPRPARERIRACVMAEWEQERALGRGRWQLPGFLPRWAAAVAAVLVVVLLGGGGTIFAAQGAVPGDILYPVKTASESVRLAFASGPGEAELLVDLTERRISEIQTLAERGKPEQIANLATRAVGHLQEVGQATPPGEESTAKLASRLEESAAEQLARLEQTITAASQEVGLVVADALAKSGEGYGMALEAIAGSSSPLVGQVELGRLQVFVTDPPPPGVEHLWVELEGIQVHRAAGSESEWVTVLDGPARFDLVALVGVQQLLGSLELEAGLYTQVRMSVTGATVSISSNEYAVVVPSETFKLVRPFRIRNQETTSLVLDFDGDASVHVTGAGQYIFRPVARLLMPGEAVLPGKDEGHPGNKVTPAPEQKEGLSTNDSPDAGKDSSQQQSHPAQKDTPGKGALPGEKEAPGHQGQPAEERPRGEGPSPGEKGMLDPQGPPAVKDSPEKSQPEGKGGPEPKAPVGKGPAGKNEAPGRDSATGEKVTPADKGPKSRSLPSPEKDTSEPQALVSGENASEGGSPMDVQTMALAAKVAPEKPQNGKHPPGKASSQGGERPPEIDSRQELKGLPGNDSSQQQEKASEKGPAPQGGKHDGHPGQGNPGGPVLHKT